MYQGERFNGISHLLGAVAALAGALVLVTLAAQQGDGWKVVSFSVYGATLFLLYLSSTLYHSIKGERRKARFRRLDHFAIYLLIAGSYTPFTLVTLRGVWGWSIFGIIWGLALLGIIVDALPNRGRRTVPVVIYLLMGWLVLVSLKPLLAALPLAGFWWLLAGGVFYSGGVVFYAFDRRVPHGHGIWHLCVLAGSVCHYLAIFYYVL
jgi:hemolysin III